MRLAQRIRSIAVVAGLVTSIAIIAETPPDATIRRVPNPPLALDLSNLPGDLRAVAVPGPSNLSDFIAASRNGTRPRQGLLLGHAGRQRRRAGVCELSFPRRGRSPIQKPGESGLEACACPGPYLLDWPQSELPAQGFGFPADASFGCRRSHQWVQSGDRQQ